MKTVAGGCCARKSSSWALFNRGRLATFPGRSEIASWKTDFARSMAMRIRSDMMGSSLC